MIVRTSGSVYVRNKSATFCFALDFASVLFETILMAYCVFDGSITARKHFAKPPYDMVELS